jgi:hypothetical protein
MPQDNSAIAVSLPVAHWQVVLTLIAKGPWETVNPVMGQILPQLAEAGVLAGGSMPGGQGVGAPGAPARPNNGEAA